jgi:hypothetical protein
MNRATVWVGAALVVASLAYGQPDTLTNSVEQIFAEGGSVRLQLASASYRLVAGSSNRILVRWEAEKAKDMRNIRVRLETTGARATIRTDGPARNADFIIELPARSDVFLRMRAGEVRMQGIEGNKDIKLTAGELEIDMEAVRYSRVHASVTFGELDARPLGISKSGIARSLEWHGSGPYSLRASLFAGELNLSAGRQR